MTVESPEPGRRYRVTGEIPALCCEGSLRPGELVEVVEQTSKNRLIAKPVKAAEPLPPGAYLGFHRVKRSTFRMNVEEVDGG